MSRYSAAASINVAGDFYGCGMGCRGSKFSIPLGAFGEVCSKTNSNSGVGPSFSMSSLKKDEVSSRRGRHVLNEANVPKR